MCQGGCEQHCQLLQRPRGKRAGREMKGRGARAWGKTGLGEVEGQAEGWGGRRLRETSKGQGTSQLKDVRGPETLPQEVGWGGTEGWTDVAGP